MEFGRVSKEELALINFNLPPEPAANAAILATGKGNTEFHIGCSKWGRKDWVGKLYAEGTKEKAFLHEYSNQFNSLELNATFYKMPDPAQIGQWRNNANVDFLFCPKFP